MIRPTLEDFTQLARQGARLIPLTRRIFSDQLTPVLAYRRLVSADEREAPSFLFESVEQSDRQGRFSFVGAQPALEIIAHQHRVRILDHGRGTVEEREDADPLRIPRAISEALGVPAPVPGLTRSVFSGGWVGYAGYDTVRYAEPGKLPFEAAPPDDRGLPDMHLGLYREVAVFDHVEKTVHATVWVQRDEHPDLISAHAAGEQALHRFVERLQTHSVPLPAGSVDIDVAARGAPLPQSNLTKEAFERAVDDAKAYIRAGDIFQVVLSQRFSRETHADPFEIYRALRVVNPSPYMIYLQARGTILVASSPEILCRVRDGVVYNRPLAGTRRRGSTEEEDRALERELLADDKERAEHIMLVDLGRNDVGRVAESGSVRVARSMEVERYSHVMHISSTVTGRLSSKHDAWDALRAALPVGTISGAPKIRAMQIIDELEPDRRGPYGGGIGAVSFHGDMDIALALRTMVIPTASTPSVLHPAAPIDSSPSSEASTASTAESDSARGPLGPKPGDGAHSRRWTVHVQAGAGVVADSVPEREYEETVHKAAALARAIDLAERAFVVTLPSAE